MFKIPRRRSEHPTGSFNGIRGAGQVDRQLQVGWLRGERLFGIIVVQDLIHRDISVFKWIDFRISEAYASACIPDPHTFGVPQEARDRCCVIFPRGHQDQCPRFHRVQFGVRASWLLSCILVRPGTSCPLLLRMPDPLAAADPAPC